MEISLGRKYPEQGILTVSVRSKCRHYSFTWFKQQKFSRLSVINVVAIIHVHYLVNLCNITNFSKSVRDLNLRPPHHPTPSSGFTDFYFHTPFVCREKHEFSFHKTTFKYKCNDFEMLTLTRMWNAWINKSQQTLQEELLWRHARTAWQQTEPSVPWDIRWSRQADS